MATIHSLNVSILDMPDEEGFDLIKQIRYDRRVAKQKRASKSTKRKPKQVSIKSLLHTLSDEARLKLLAELEGD